MEFTISEKTSLLSMPEGFCFYRDQLAWHPHPVYPPWAKVKDAGKHPAVSKWWEFDPYDCDVEKWFGGQQPHNIGLAPKDGLVIVDLDSKIDKGASVQKFLAEHPEIANSPRHQTRNGVHIPYFCPDLPKFTHPNGKPYHDKLVSTLNASVTAELFHSDHSNVVLPPSVHPLDNFRYVWTVFGLIPEISWEWLQQTYGFSPPAFPAQKTKHRKARRWFDVYAGDLHSLDLIALLEALGHPAQLLDLDEGKYAIRCPWADEHTTEKSDEPDSSTAVWQRLDEHLPAFKCLHLHCAQRLLEQLLEWAETKEPGIVNRFCSRERVWRTGQKSRRGLPRVLHAEGRLESAVYEEIGQILGPKHEWFNRGNEVVAIRKVPSGFVYSDNPATRYSVSSFQVGLSALSPLQAKSSLEKYIEPGYLTKDREFVPCSFATEFCAGLLQSEQLKELLLHIVRILPVGLPFRDGDKLVYPKVGYDRQFGTYLLPDAPKITTVPIERALKVLAALQGDFCFTDDQSRTHALAALLTPFSRGLIGWTTRTPLWFYSANRPRAGKDYLRAITLLTYEGHAFEDLPIGRESEETGKRIMAAARSGRRFMHFSNCQVHLQDAYLTQVLTNPVINGRRLGSNDASSDLSLPNEIEFSLSANVGLTYREDFEPRMRKIELAYFEEDPNERKFKDKFLHRTVTENRSLILSSIAALFNYWAQQGFPAGKSDFISYPQWAQTIGGVMHAAGLGDPCLPFKGTYETGGDLKTAAMSALFRLGLKTFRDNWVTKHQIYQAIHKAVTADDDDTEPLRWFGPMEDTEDARSNQTKLGLQLHTFRNRILSGIKLEIDTSSAKSTQHRYRFVPVEKSPKPSPPEMDTLDTLDTFIGPSRARDVTPKNANADGGVCNAVAKNSPLEVPKVAKVSTWDVLSGQFLAVDIETCAEVKVSRRGTPKITSTREALDPWKGEIRLITVGDPAGNIRSFDLREAPLPDEILAGLERCPLIVHNACFDLLFLKVRLGIAPQEVFCTMTASRLLKPLRTVSHSLGATLWEYLGVELAKEHGSSDWGAFVLTEAQLDYATDDVRHLHKLEATLRKELEDAQLQEIFALEMQLVPIVVAMEHHGFAVDRAKLEQIHAEALSALRKSFALLRERFGVATLNPDSPDQLREAFKTSGLELENTDETTLAALCDDRAKLVLEHRGQAKLKTLTAALLKAAQADSRIHARFNPTGSLTGRFSSKGPNLQNITRGELRSCFVASGPERSLIVADYSQIELRIGAYFAQDETMLTAFRTGKDLHRETAAAVLSKPVSKVTKAERQLAKAVNFGFLYGRQAKGFRTDAQTEYGIVLTLEEATELRTKFFSRYEGLARWHHQAWQKAQEDVCEARTILGRLLVAQGDRDWDRFQLQTSYRVSGSAADVLKKAMVKVGSIVPSEVQLVATVHDELVFDCPSREAPQYLGIIRAVMQEGFGELFPELPIEVEAKICANWAEK